MLGGSSNVTYICLTRRDVRRENAFLDSSACFAFSPPHHSRVLTGGLDSPWFSGTPFRSSRAFGSSTGPRFSGALIGLDELHFSLHPVSKESPWSFPLGDGSDDHRFYGGRWLRDSPDALVEASHRLCPLIAGGVPNEAPPLRQPHSQVISPSATKTWSLQLQGAQKVVLAPQL